MMCRNDFELLANGLKAAEASINTPECAEGFNIAVNVVASVCKASNARFQKAKFFAACGITGTNQAD